MAKKKTPPAKQFIAIDTYDEKLISKGSLEHVTQVLECYVQDEDYDMEEIAENIEVYELAELKKVQTFHRAPGITIES